MNGLAVPEDPRGVADVTPTTADAKSPVLTLTPDQERLEALYASAVAVEYIRIRQPADSRSAASYSASVIDNSRLLSGGRPQQHLNQLRHMVRWLRGLRPGSEELRWSIPGGNKS
jgi:hypothetical protein